MNDPSQDTDRLLKVMVLHGAPDEETAREVLVAALSQAEIAARKESTALGRMQKQLKVLREAADG